MSKREILWKFFASLSSYERIKKYITFSHARQIILLKPFCCISFYVWFTDVVHYRPSVNPICSFWWKVTELNMILFWITKKKRNPVLITFRPSMPLTKGYYGVTRQRKLEAPGRIITNARLYRLDIKILTSVQPFWGNLNSICLLYAFLGILMFGRCRLIFVLLFKY